ncbi:hypothetical protein FAP39_09495 [Shimia litoralis]|uniref:Lipoprotein n=1 Tax=Shimia litoralis TaxID=420403 RepID=A0A4V6YFK2_9RHOB|nr:hypothetical protein [Shimia litoralis]TKZ20751.1 hypothetical protein FAP39_09495 [Shimia litoralis]
MKHTLGVLLVVTMALGACQSRWNPVNWFGDSEEIAVPEGEINPLIPEKSQLVTRPEAVYGGLPVYKVTDVKIEKTAGGAIIRVAGVAAVQGVHTVKLQPPSEGQNTKGVLVYNLLAIHPRPAPGVGTEQSREIHVAHSLTEQQLAGISTIKIVAANNARQVRR